MSAKPTECAYLSVIDHKKLDIILKYVRIINPRSFECLIFIFKIYNIYINYLIVNSVSTKSFLVYNTAKSLLSFEFSDV